MRVSVVLTVYNAAWCVGRALEHALGQTRPADEILVCDDGSTDGTPDVIESRFGSAVTVLRLPHRNASATRRAGLERAAGDWLAFLDADDWWVPDKLERQFAYLERHPEVRWLSSDGVFESADEVLRESWLSDYFRPVRELSGDLMPYLIERCFPLVSSMLVERRAYQEVGGLDPEMVFSHDYDLWLRLAARYPGAVLPERLVHYFSSPGSLSRRFEDRNRDDLLLMRRLGRRESRLRPELRRRAVRRAAALEFDLGVSSLRAGRTAEGRRRLWRAAAYGPVRRRLFAALGAVLPGRMLPALMRSEWLKTRVEGARRRVAPVSLEDPAGGPS